MKAAAILETVLVAVFFVGTLAPTVEVNPASVAPAASSALPAAPSVPRPPPAPASPPIPGDFLPPNTELPGVDSPGATPAAGSGVLAPRPPSSEGRMPLERVVGELANDFTPAGIARVLRAYYATAGLDAPNGDFGSFEQNATLTFTYRLGDLNGDGVDDVAMNTYCVDREACTPVGGSSIPPSIAFTHGQDLCSIPNRLFGVSGATGDILWQLNMSRREWNLTGDPVGYVEHTRGILCPTDFVVGEVPRPGGGFDLLLYRFAIASTGAVTGAANPDVYVVHHEVRLIDRTDGRTRWRHAENGTVALARTPGGLFVMKADSFLVNPILQVPPSLGVRLLAPQRTPALFLQGVGFDVLLDAAPSPLPGHTAPYPLLDEYHPREWADRIDLLLGRELWRNANTFTPREGVSVVPLALQDRQPLPFDAPFGDTGYWHDVPCCFDLTGDNVPDLLYTTVEWMDKPLIDGKGPFMLASRLVLFDGATGRPVWDVVTEPGTQRYLHEETGGGVTCYAPTPVGFYDCYGFHPWFELLGDVNGDGVDDVLLHLVYFQEDYRHSLSVRDGKTGQELWRLDRPRDVAALVLGNADDRGGNDFLTVEWQDWEFPFAKEYHTDNVSVLPITVWSGDTGRVLWRAKTATFNAPIDLVTMFQNFKTGGLPDVDHDGVGDVPVDDPLFLPDLEVVHRESYLSGASGRPLFHFDGVGSFAFVSYAGDLNGDGTDDFALLNGDILDLWTTMYDGHTGNALWSHRLLTPRVVDYVTAVPRLRYHPLHVRDEAADRTLVNFQFEVQSLGGFFFTDVRYPQIASYLPNGSTPWSMPAFDDHYLEGWVKGATTGTRAYHNLLHAEAAPRGAAATARTVATTSAPFVGLYGLFLTIALPVAKWAPWRRWRS